MVVRAGIGAIWSPVTLLESPGRSRSIYYSTDLEQEIPGGLKTTPPRLHGAAFLFA